MTDMISFDRVDGLYLQPVKGKGLGVFCAQRIEENCCIETAPVLAFSKDDAWHIDQTNLYNYYFSADFLHEQDKDKEKAGCFVLGMLSMCNHAAAPNARIEKHVRDEQIFFRLVALQAIDPHCEICISYGTIWFEPVQE